MDYLFINSYLKAKESNFLTDAQFTILSEAKKDNFLKTLHDFSNTYDNNRENLEDLLNKSEENLLNDLDFLLGENNRLSKIIKLLNDLTNIKIIYKQIHNNNYLEFYNKLGNYSFVCIDNALRHKNFNLVRDDLELFESIVKISKNLTIYDAINEIIKITYDYIFNKYINKFDKYVKRFFQLKMTNINILTILRSIKLELNESAIEKSLCNNGLIDKEIMFEYLYRRRDPKILSIYLPHNYYKLLSILDYNNPLMIEDELNLIIDDEIKLFDTYIDTIAPIISYILKSKKEIERIRKVHYIYKLNNKKRKGS